MASVEEGSVVEVQLEVRELEKEGGRKENKLLIKAKSMGFSDREAQRMLRMYGGKRLNEILRRAKTEGGALGSQFAMSTMTRVAMADSMFQDMTRTQGVSWMKIVDGVKVRLKLDLLMIYNGSLKGPKAKIVTKTKKEVPVETHGIGMVLNTRGCWATFGLLQPHGKEWSEWEPCFFAGDPSGQKTYTLIKRVSDGCDVTNEQWAGIEDLGFKMAGKRDNREAHRRLPTGIPISLLKRAANDTIKLAGFEGKPGWQDGVDLRDGDHPERAIATVKDDRARALLEKYWFTDSIEDEDDDDEGDIWADD